MARNRHYEPRMDLCNTDANTPFLSQLFLWENYLPLASNTRFVEAGVKEAQVASSTHRGEELRSAYAIIRSSRILSVGTLSEMKINNKIQAFIRLAHQFEEIQEAMAAEEGFEEELSKMIEKHHKKHFKHERISGLKRSMTEKESTNKKQNKRQKTASVDETLGQKGLIACGGGVVKRFHKKDVEMELKQRQCPPELIDAFPSNQWKQMKKWLMDHEIETVTDCGGSEDDIKDAFKGFRLKRAN